MSDKGSLRVSRRQTTEGGINENLNNNSNNNNVNTSVTVANSSVDDSEKKVYKFRRGAQRTVIHVDSNTQPLGTRVFSALRKHSSRSKISNLSSI